MEVQVDLQEVATALSQQIGQQANEIAHLRAGLAAIQRELAAAHARVLELESEGVEPA